MIRGRDKTGPFYRSEWTGKKHYYTANDKASRDLAKRHAISGAGIVDTVKEGYTRVKNTLSGPRDSIPPKLQEFLRDKGSQKIKSIEIARQPVSSGIQTFLDALSLGNYSKTKKKLNYDDVYHSYLIVTTDDGKKYKLEKNSIVEASPATDKDYNSEHRPIPLNNRDLTLDSLVGNAAAKRGKDLWRYDAKSTNCQDFAKNILQDSDLQVTDKKTQEIINPQDGVALVDSLGKLRGVPKVITDIQASLDRLKNGGTLGRRGISVKRLFDIANSPNL